MSLENIFSGFIGAIAGGLFTVLGTCLSYDYQRKINKESDENKVKVFLISIKSEISSVWDRYSESMGQMVENLSDGTGLDAYYPISENYFLVYDCNTNMIGNFDADLSSSIIKTYTLAKGLKDSFLFNNNLLSEINNYHDISQDKQSLHYKSQLENHIKIWQEYGSSLKEHHQMLKKSKEDMILSIDKYLSSHQ